MALYNDMKMAESTYLSFVSFIKWGAILCAAVAALVIILIS